MRRIVRRHDSRITARSAASASAVHKWEKMDSEESQQIRPGRLFLVLWLFATVAGIVSLQVRLAVFGGTGWLTSVKFTAWPDRLGLIAMFAIMMAALAGAWTLLFDTASRLFRLRQPRMMRLCATLGVVIIAADLFFRHKVTELLGNAFSFFEFATGVGGVWRMIVQAFGWYGDIILMALLGLAAVTVGAWFLFKWILRPGKRQWLCDRMPRPVLAILTFASICAGFAFMSILAPTFPAASRLLGDETMAGASFHGIVHVATDWDNDGYGTFDLPPDTAPDDPACHPHAVDVPNDGIDQDLLLGDLDANEIPAQMRQYLDSYGTPAHYDGPKRRHVIVVLMESVRHDMLDATIDNSPVMPNLHRIIDRGGLRVDGFFATRGFTQNSVTQTFWGSYFDPGHSLVDDFRSMGYKTAAYSGEELSDEGFDESLGWNRAGDVVVDPGTIAANVDHHKSVPASMLMDEVEGFIGEHDPAKPLFLYIFYQDPHFPYNQDNPPIYADHAVKRSEITAQRRALLYRTYAGHVHHVDMAAGRLFDALEKRGMLDDSLIVFASDHGESLFDDGYLLGHGIAIQDVMTHGVMVVWGATRDIPATLSHADLRSLISSNLAPATGKRPTVLPTSRPVMQFIGATTVPSAIAFRYGSGDRITYEFTTGNAWHETDKPDVPGHKPRQILPFANEPASDRRAIPRDLTNGGRFYAPIPDPLHNSDVQLLIRAWEYMQYRGRG